jgi:pyruvate carboxylase subunit A
MGLYGVKTTKPFYFEILRTNEFQSGKFDTGFIEQHEELLNYSVRRSPADLTAAIAAAVVAYHGL